MTLKKYQPLFLLQQAIRNFFLKENFLDVLTPPVVTNPGMEIHIHPFQLFSIKRNSSENLFLHTSPEFHMKSLLSHGYEKIFTMSYAFRDESNSEHHRSQFLMLEWYRSGEYYTKIMEDIKELLPYCLNYLKKENINCLDSIKIQKISVSNLFLELLDIQILDFLDKKDIYQLIKKNYKYLYLEDIVKYSWTDLYFLLFLNEIEPKLSQYEFLILEEFPAPLKALATLKNNDLRLSERFELYYKGLEICNCFNELTDLTEQRKRFKEQHLIKKSLYHYELPPANLLYDALKRGVPNSSGVALGVERLLIALTNTEVPFWD